MLVKRTRANQITIPKKIMRKAGLTAQDLYFDLDYANGVIYVCPVSISKKLPVKKRRP